MIALSELSLDLYYYYIADIQHQVTYHKFQNKTYIAKCWLEESISVKLFL